MVDVLLQKQMICEFMYALPMIPKEIEKMPR